MRAAYKRYPTCFDHLTRCLHRARCAREGLWSEQNFTLTTNQSPSRAPPEVPENRKGTLFSCFAAAHAVCVSTWLGEAKLVYVVHSFVVRRAHPPTILNRFASNGGSDNVKQLVCLPCAHGPSRAASSMLPMLCSLCYVREANERTTSWITRLYQRWLARRSMHDARGAW